MFKIPLLSVADFSLLERALLVYEEAIAKEKENALLRMKRHKADVWDESYINYLDSRGRHITFLRKKIATRENEA